MIAELVPLDQTRVGLDLIEKGRKVGEERILKQSREQLRAIAQRLFASGLPVEQISDFFQLPIADVHQLLQESQ